MIKIFLLFVFLCIFLVSQYDAINNARHECHAQFQKDLQLLSRDVCVDKLDRINFDSMVDCKGAEQRQRQTMPVCTVLRWFNKTDLVNIYRKLTDSYWAILGFVLPTIFILLHYHHHNKQNNNNNALVEWGRKN